MLLKVFVGNVYFRGYLNETWHAFIVYMFRWRPEVLHSVGDNALISGFGKGPIVLKTAFQDGGGRTSMVSQNNNFGLVYDMIHQFRGMEANNYKFGMFCQQCHPSVARGDADIRPRNASQIHTCYLFML